MKKRKSRNYLPRPADGTLAYRLYELRQSMDMTFPEFAKKTGVSTTNLSKIEIGGHVPGVEVLSKIARSLNVPIASLLTAEKK